MISWLAILRKVKDSALFVLQRLYDMLAVSIDAKCAVGSALIIAPHPDDETLGCGATIAQMHTRGQKIRVLIVTNGAASGNSAIISPEELTQIRHRECVQAVKILGLTPEDIVFLGYPDGDATGMIDAMAEDFRKHVIDFLPALVLSPFSEDAHPDHRAVAEAVGKLQQDAIITCPVYEYPISFWPFGALRQLMHPERLRRLRRTDTKEHLVTKMKAMKSYQSQLENLTGETGWFYFKPEQILRFFRKYEIFFERFPP